MHLAEQHVRVFKLSDYTKDDPKAGSCASALIGPEGGVVTVTDPASPIFGTSLRIPAGALDAPARITIQEGDHSCDFGLGPSIKLLPDGLHFKKATTLTVYLNDSKVEDDKFDSDFPTFYQYDECSNQWAHNDGASLEKMGNAVLCELHHL